MQVMLSPCRHCGGHPKAFRVNVAQYAEMAGLAFVHLGSRRGPLYMLICGNCSRNARGPDLAAAVCRWNEDNLTDCEVVAR